MMSPTFEVLRDPARRGSYRLRMTGPSGEVFSDLAGLPNLDAVRSAIAQIREAAAQALVVDRTAHGG
jgi:hypothetical protein